MEDNKDIARIAADIELLVLDVDGVLTDGRLILGPNGEESKAFHVRDGHGLVTVRDAGIAIAIITGRTSSVVETRMRELGVAHVHQGIRDKAACLRYIIDELGVAPEHVCYVGDDVPDRDAMRMVGLAVAVADACDEIHAVAALTTRRNGGCGAVREVCDLILGARR